MGHKTATIKADNERPINALMEELRKARGEDAVTLLETVPEGDEQSNCHGEGAVNILKGLIRTLKSSTEDRLGEEIDPEHPIMPWLIDHAAELRNHFQVQDNGKTPVEALMGEECGSDGI